MSPQEHRHAVLSIVSSSLWLFPHFSCRWAVSWYISLSSSWVVISCPSIIQVFRHYVSCFDIVQSLVGWKSCLFDLFLVFFFLSLFLSCCIFALTQKYYLGNKIRKIVLKSIDLMSVSIDTVPMFCGDRLVVFYLHISYFIHKIQSYGISRLFFANAFFTGNLCCCLKLCCLNRQAAFEWESEACRQNLSHCEC